MRLPSEYKRKYEFKSNRKGDRLGYIIAIVISAIAVLLFWYFG
ncbi:hypothetical protein ACXZ1K_06940 [Pedobacter sp. PWIIR3]